MHAQSFERHTIRAVHIMTEMNVGPSQLKAHPNQIVCKNNYNPPNKLTNQKHYIHTYIHTSSYHAGSTDIPDPLLPLLPIVHRPR